MTADHGRMTLGNTAAPTVSAGYASALLAYAERCGADRRRLLRAADIASAALEDPDRRVPYGRFVALMRAAKIETGDPAFALHFGADSDFRKWSVVGLIAFASATMVEALEQLNRYGRLVVETAGLAGGPRFSNVVRDGGLWLEDNRLNPNDFPEQTESSWSRFIVESRVNFPEHTFALEAHVTHPKPPHWRVYEEIWQVPVTFSAQRNAIRMNPAWPAVRIAPDNRYAFGVLSEKAEALLAALETRASLRGRVEQLLMPMLHTGDADIAAIAAKLGISRQTLYRKLKAEGVTFAAVLDDLRRQLAAHYLDGRKVSVNETAYLLGFSEPSAFSRAFKRWTGASPRAAFRSARPVRSAAPVERRRG